MSGKVTPNKSVVSVQMFCRFDAGGRLQYCHYPLATVNDFKITIICVKVLIFP